ncbi:MAG: PEGA domain-containing protein [Methanoregulaceae archaeon]
MVSTFNQTEPVTTATTTPVTTIPSPTEAVIESNATIEENETSAMLPVNETSVPTVTATLLNTTIVTTTLTTVSSTSEYGTGNITVASSPLGASILLDGTYLGTTPANVSSIAQGNHIIRLTMSGYYDYEGTIYVTPERTTPVFGTLQPSGGYSAAVTQAPAATQTTAAPTATAAPTTTSSTGIFENPTVIAAIIGTITASIGAGATIFSHIAKARKE